jgi:unsaturated rhamnogalacturonyl hydrolase
MMKKLVFLIVCSMMVSATQAQSKEQTEAILRKISSRIIDETSYKFIDTKTGQTYDNLNGVPFSLNIKIQSRYNDWHYTNGVLNIALMELGKQLHDVQYENYVLKNMDFIFNPGNLNYLQRQYDAVSNQENGLEKVSRLSNYMFYRMIRLDDYGTMAASLVDLYEHQKNPAFKQYFDKAIHALEYAEPRLKDGTIARYFPHTMTVWADDLYMSVSLLARMGKLTGDAKYFDDAVKQVLQFHKYLWDNNKQIYYHCYYTDTQHNGVAYWGRCNGWMMMAQADLLSNLPQNHPKRALLLKMFQQEALGISRYQSQSGLWHQLLDKTDSYEETSCSAMFTFSIARGVNRGWLEPDFAQVADFGWKGILSKITEEGDVTAICPGTGIAPSLPVYYSRPPGKNTPMGEGPVLRAGAEILQLKPYHEIRASETYHLVKDRSKK